MIFPYAITTKKSAFFDFSQSAKFFTSNQYFLESKRTEFGVWTSEIQRSIAVFLIIFGFTSIHLPLGASGIVTTQTTSNLLSPCNSCKNGTQICAHEKNTTL
jgi:hypothetical protein